MGREANCLCQWGSESAHCKVLLETKELIVRGAMRHRAEISSLSNVLVDGEELHFSAGNEKVVLHLGESLAQSWAKKIATPPPTLAAKLGVNRDSRLLLIGEFETEELRKVIAAARSSNGREANLILARTETATDLNFVLDRYSAQPSRPPIWIIYPKGANKPLPESEIRTIFRHEGFIDIKVASVSTTLTALKFIKRA